MIDPVIYASTKGGKDRKGKERLGQCCVIHAGHVSVLVHLLP